MKVGFFYQGASESSIIHFTIAKYLIASVRKSMPGVEIWQLTDDQSPLHPGIDGHIIEPGIMPMAVRRMTLQGKCEGEWLFVDTDIIIQKDVRDVFDETFDVALTDREGTITNEAAYAKVMPYNIGVVFSRSPRFWQVVAKYLKTLPAKFQQWEGDQRVVCQMMKEKVDLEHGFNVKILHGAMFNYPPKFSGDGKDAAICHFKGNRKTYLTESLEAA